MYLKAELQIDPSQAEKIERVKPQRAFKRLLYHLTGGNVTDKAARETFGAISVLQQIQAAFHALGVDNIIRLSKDNFDYYFDEEGLDNDFQQAMENFQSEVSEEQAGLFEHLFLVMEHGEEIIHFLIEVQINRIHPINEFPISIIINGIFSEFDANKDEDAQSISAKLHGTFRSQQNYDELITEMEGLFHNFIEKVKNALRQFVGVNEIRESFKRIMIRPKVFLAYPNELPNTRNAVISPVFHGYFGINKLIFYAWIWGDMCYENNIKVKEVELVDEQENLLLLVEAEPMNEEMLRLLNTDVEFNLPSVNVTDENLDVEKSLTFSFANLYEPMPEDTNDEFDWLKKPEE